MSICRASLRAGGRAQPRPEVRERDLIVGDVLDLHAGDREHPLAELGARVVVPLGDLAARPEREPDRLLLAGEQEEALEAVGLQG